MVTTINVTAQQSCSSILSTQCFDKFVNVCGQRTTSTLLVVPKTGAAEFSEAILTKGQLIRLSWYPNSDCVDHEEMNCGVVVRSLAPCQKSCPGIVVFLYGASTSGCCNSKCSEFAGEQTVMQLGTRQHALVLQQFEIKHSVTRSAFWLTSETKY